MARAAAPAGPSEGRGTAGPSVHWRRARAWAQAGDERAAIARVRGERALPRAAAHDERRLGEEEAQRRAGLVRGEHAARVIEVEVAQHDDVDVLVREAARTERVEEHVAILGDAVARAYLRLEERADPRLQEDLAVALVDERGAARDLDAACVVRRVPAAPERARGVAEHRAAVE